MDALNFMALETVGAAMHPTDRKSNDLTNVEALGEWDHGMSDPLAQEAKTDQETTTNPYRKLMDRVVNADHSCLEKAVHAEHVVEDAVRNHMDRVNHKLEEWMVPLHTRNAVEDADADDHDSEEKESRKRFILIQLVF